MVTVRSIVSVLLTIGLPLIAGCTGHGSVWAKPLSRSDIRDNEPLVYPFPAAAECAYFVDDKGQIHIALRYEKLPLLGEFSRVTWFMHIRATDSPRGRAMTARLLRDQIRAIYSAGVDHRRFDSRWGVLVLSRLSDDRFRGRFDATVAQQQFSILAGWNPTGYQAPLMSMWGEFEAIHDEKRARSIIQVIEREDWTDLVGRPMTQPTPLRFRIPATAPTTTRRSTTEDRPSLPRPGTTGSR